MVTRGNAVLGNPVTLHNEHHHEHKKEKCNGNLKKLL